MRLRAVLIPVVLLGAGLSACGSDGKAAGDRAAITAVARSVATSPRDDAECRTKLTADFVREVFGDESTCARTTESAPTATGAKVEQIAVDGDSATAVVTEQGGGADGATGTWAFVRDGAGWRVSEWRTDYLRAEFRAKFGPAYRASAPGDPFADPTVRACVGGRLQALADAEFRATAYQILRQSDAGEQALRGWYYDCIGQTSAGGVSALRQVFEDGLRQTDQIPPAVVNCVVRKLRTTVSDAEIRAMGASGATKIPPSVQQRITAATVACVHRTPPSASPS